ncbi:FtsK/SpoIIIE domain-containing protein [Ilumatobacter sp.]|uniref:FtsK/SpoIIIE domain-containing protein n=1 Tax=Ilumatobacter sp. TaxID=1967498 RepID=UPI003B51E235
MERETLPPLDLVGPDGQRLVVRSLDADATVSTLAGRLGVPGLGTPEGPLPGDARLATLDAVRIGTRLLGRDGPVPGAAIDPVPAGAITGSAVASAGGRIPGAIGAPASPGPTTAVVEAAVVSGPAVTTWRGVVPGRHLVGRAPHAALRIDDPTVEAHHAVLVVGDGGEVDLVQLTGAVPIRREDGAGAMLSLRIGSSTVALRTAVGAHAGADSGSGVVPDEPAGRGSIAPHPSDPWRRMVWRAPWSAPVWDSAPISAPAPPSAVSRPPLTGLVGAGVTAAGAVVVANVMGNATFVLFAAMGVIASVATFAATLIGARRADRRARAAHDAELGEFVDAVQRVHRRRRDHHVATHPPLDVALAEVLGGGQRLWHRRPGDGALVATVGVGTCRWSPPVEVGEPRLLDPDLLVRIEGCGRVDDVAAPVSIRDGEALAIVGGIDAARSIARSIVVQLATWTGPADWRLVVVTADRRRWRWADWLPHGALAGRSVIEVIDGADVDLQEELDSVTSDVRTVLVTDAAHLFTSRTGPLRRFVSASGAASIVVVDAAATVPAICRRTLTLGSTGGASWSGHVPVADDAVGIRATGVSIDTADEVARRLACLVDPEDPHGPSDAVPVAVAFDDLVAPEAATAEAIAARWVAGGDDPAPRAPLGISAEGTVDIDLVRDGPHGLIAGTTGSGKSELLRTLVLSLAAHVGPEHLNLVLVDYKGGSTFDACADLPHTVGVVTDLDDGLAERALVSLEAELHRRERLLREVGAGDLTAYRAAGSRGPDGRAPIARLLVVIDEFAALAEELPTFLAALVGIAQRGRSLGVHLLLATQRPAGVVNDDIRANTDLRLALRSNDRADALDVVGDELPSRFPRHVPGRAVMRLGPDELVVFQAGRCSGRANPGGTGIVVERPDAPGRTIDAAPAGRIGPDDHRRSAAATGRLDVVETGPTTMEATVRAISDAALAGGAAAPHRPWVEPLPFPLDRREVAEGSAPPGGRGRHGPDPDPDPGTPAIGLVDDPEHQRRVPLRWSPGDGGVAVVGSVGSGATSTLIALASAACAARSPDELHLYVVDGRGDDGLGALATIAHCAGVVRTREHERLHRLLARVVTAIDLRTGLATDVGAEPDIVVVIDGHDAVRSSLGDLDRMATEELLRRVLDDGPAAGISLLIATDEVHGATLSKFPHRWILHLDDPAAARSIGLRAAPVGSGRPGRLRVLETGLEAQVARGAPGLAELASHDDDAGGPPPVVTLPDRVDGGDLDHRGRGSVGPDGSATMRIGIEADELATAVLTVPPGDHLLVVGAARTGVTTALERCVADWRPDDPTRRVVRVDRRHPVDGAAIVGSEGPTLVVVDDAHRVDDHDGALAAIVRGEHPRVTVFAGGRADGVRSSYGHWTREVARCRCGIVMTSRGDPDGDLLGVQLPRRSLIPARPGLAWIVDPGPQRQVQIAS